MEPKVNYKFKKNESFYIRDGWFEKALCTIKENKVPNVFSKNLGSQLLGIGASMAKGLKFWLQAARIIEISSTKTELTQFGKLIARYDSYFEDNFTWFLIHYFLCTDKEYNPVFYSFFNSNIKSIRRNELLNCLLNDFSDSAIPVRSDYVEDDIGVFLKSYLGDGFINNPEDNYICPLSSLKLIKKKDDLIEKQKPVYSKLSYLVVYFALGQLFNNKSFNIEDSFEMDGSPFKIFNLDKNNYLQYLEEMQRNGLITINKTAGLNTVYFEREASLSNVFKIYFEGGEN